MKGFAVLQFFETDQFFSPCTVWLIAIWYTKEWNAVGTAWNRSLVLFNLLLYQLVVDPGPTYTEN